MSSSTGLFVSSIVEGHGEVDAFEVLVRRIAAGLRLDVGKPHRLTRGQITAGTEEFKRAIRLQANRVRLKRPGLIFVCVDTDGEDATTLATKLSQNAAGLADDVPIRSLLFTQEYESMFIHEQPSIARHVRVRPSPQFTSDPESVRNAKGWFERQILKSGEKYSETVDQRLFTFCLDRGLCLQKLASCRNLLRDLADCSSL